MVPWGGQSSSRLRSQEPAAGLAAWTRQIATRFARLGVRRPSGAGNSRTDRYGLLDDGGERPSTDALGHSAGSTLPTAVVNSRPEAARM